MPLSEHEQRQLEQIEQAIVKEDPRFAGMFHEWRIRVFRFRRTPRPPELRRSTTHRNHHENPSHSRLPKVLRDIPSWIVQTSGALAVVGATLALLTVISNRKYTTMGQFEDWSAAYAAIIFFGTFSIFYTLHRTFWSKDFRIRLLGGLLTSVFLTATFIGITLVTHIP